jgi:hypothetical protein
MSKAQAACMLISAAIGGHICRQDAINIIFGSSLGWPVPMQLFAFKLVVLIFIVK